MSHSKLQDTKLAITPRNGSGHLPLEVFWAYSAERIGERIINLISSPSGGTEKLAYGEKYVEYPA